MRTVFLLLVLAYIANADLSTEEVLAEEGSKVKDPNSTDYRSVPIFPFHYDAPDYYTNVFNLIKQIPHFHPKIERILALYTSSMGMSKFYRVVYQLGESICSLLFVREQPKYVGFLESECSPLLRYKGIKKNPKPKKVANRAATRKPSHSKAIPLQHWEDDSSGY